MSSKNVLTRSLLLIILFNGMCASALAQTAIPTSSQPAIKQPIRPALRSVTPKGEKAADATESTPSSTGKMIGSLLVIVAFIVIGAKLLGRSNLVQATATEEVLDVLCRRNLDPKQSMHLVRCGDRVLLLGSGPNGLVSLCEIDNPQEAREIIQKCTESESSGTSSSKFMSLFRVSIHSD